MKPAISVVVPVFNGEKYIETQLSSIKEQITDHDELIIIDDASKDNSFEIIQRLAKDTLNVNIYRNTSNLGLRKSINKLIALSKKDIVMFADQDDEWLPGRLEIARERHAWADCVIVDAKICNEDLEVKSKSYLDHINFSLSPIKMLARCRVLGCCMSFKKKCFDDAFIPTGCFHDHFLMMYFLVAGLKFEIVCEPFIRYRRHDGALSAAAKQEISPRKFISVPWARLILIGQLALLFGRQFFFQGLISSKRKPTT